MTITKSKQVRIDRSKIREAERYDGKWVLETNDDTISLEDAALIERVAEIACRKPYSCDFTREFSRLEGAVAMDCDDRFRDWKIGITRPVAAKPTQVSTLLDGVIVY